MTYAYDDSIQMPVMDLYDTQMMLASINAARDMYKSRLEEIKDFKKQYGDFYSPILKDMEEYNNTIIKPILDAISSMYKNGIDPLRNAEAYGRINSIINSVNPGRVNFLKQRALNAEKMYESISKLRALNAFNPEFAKYNNEDPLSWDSNYIGASSATPYLDYETKYGHLFDKMDYEYDPKAQDIPQGMLAMTKNRSRMRDILNSTILDLQGDPQFKYDLEKLIKNVPNTNNQLDEWQIKNIAQNILLDEIVNRNHKGGMKLVEDPIARDNRHFNNQVRLENIRRDNEIDIYNKTKGSESEDDDTPNIFRGAEKAAKNKPAGVVGDHVLYEMSEQYYQQIDPVILAGMTLAKNDKTGAMIPVYQFKGSDISRPGAIAYLGTDGKMYDARLRNVRPDEDFQFTGNGNMRAQRIGINRNGSPIYRYWISGQIKSTREPNNELLYSGENKNIKNTTHTIWIPVKERGYNYGQTLKKN